MTGERIRIQMFVTFGRPARKVDEARVSVLLELRGAWRPLDGIRNRGQKLALRAEIEAALKSVLSERTNEDVKIEECELPLVM